MKKSLILSLLCLFCSVQSAQANILSLGPRVGGSYAQLKIRQNQHSFRISNRFGYHIGVVAQVSLPPFSVQPEVLFVGSSVYVTKKQDEIQLSFNKIDVPVMLCFSLFGFRLQAGPSLSILLSAAQKNESMEQIYKRFTVGYQAGIGYDIKNFIIDFKYEGNLTRFGDRIGGLKTDHRLHQVVLSVGFNVL